MILLMGLLLLICPKSQKARNLYIKVKEKLVWNFYLRLVIENYLATALTNVLRLKNLSAVNWY